MPAASSSRRRTATNGRSRREPSSDRIEEDEPSQQQDDVDAEGEDEEVQPRRSVKKVKAEKLSKASRRKAAEQDDDEDPQDAQQNVEVDEDAPIDVENFPDHPIEKKEGQKLIGLANDWSNFRKSIHKNSYNLVQDVAGSMAEVTEGEAGDKALTELDNIIKELIDIDEELLSNEKTVEDLHQVIAQGILVDDAIDRYEKQVKKKINDYRHKTTRQKYAKNEEYAAFKQRIWEVQNPDKGMPPVTEFIPREDGDASDDDDDLEVGGITQDYKCPLTLTILVDPYTSQVCGHSFSKEAILDFLKGNRGTKQKCPASGCNRELTQADLKPNKDLAKRIKAVARRQQMQDDDSDEEEVIE